MELQWYDIRELTEDAALAGKLADGVGDVDAGGRGELEGVAVRLNGVVLANPLERFVHHLEIIFIQVHQVAFQGGLVEKLVHQGARGFLVQVQLSLIHI